MASDYDSVDLYVKAWNECGRSDADTLRIYLGPKIPADIDGDQSVCAEDVYEYSTDGSFGATSYIWSYPGDATLLGSGTGYSIILIWGTSNGDVTVQAVNNCNTSEEATISVTVDCRIAQYHNQENVPEVNEILTFPNPTSGALSIIYNSQEESSCLISFSDMAGRLVLHSEGKVNKGVNLRDFDLSSMAKGIYFLEIRLRNKIEQIKVIIQ